VKHLRAIDIIPIRSNHINLRDWSYIISEEQLAQPNNSTDKINEQSFLKPLEPELDAVLNIARDEDFEVRVMHRTITEIGWSMEYQFIRIDGTDVNVIEELIRRFYYIQGSVEFNLGELTVVGEANVLRGFPFTYDHYNDIDTAINSSMLAAAKAFDWENEKHKTCFFYFGVEGSYKGTVLSQFK